MQTIQLLAVAVALFAGPTRASEKTTQTSSAQPTVVLPSGAKIFGTIETSVNTGSKVNVFRGIPFAEPPVGKLRFSQTKLKTLTKDVNATDFGPICYGTPLYDPVSGEFPPSEDCLYINVYTPAKATKLSNLPVMVWVYGGGFGAGAANPYPGTNLVGAADSQVVVVSFNYRVGALGFLSNEAILAEGNGANFGLRDQETAFQWVQQNIRNFGGNPNDVTAFGESAGGISIGLQLIAREAKQKLFHRAIMSSGTYSNAFDTPSKARQIGFTNFLASGLGCPTTVNAEQLSCLRSKDAGALHKVFLTAPFKYFPTVDGIFLKDIPSKLVSSGKISAVPTLIGTNTDDGFGFASGPGADPAQFDSYIRSAYSNLTDAEYKQIGDLYPAGQFPTAQHRTGEIFGDVTFYCPADKVTDVLAKQAFLTPPFRYRFNQTAPFNGLKLAVHAADNDYVFNRVDRLPKDDPTVPAVVKLIQRSWTNFGRFGFPNGFDIPSTIWPSYIFGQSQLVLQEKPVVENAKTWRAGRVERCQFWYSIDLRLAKDNQY